MCFLPYGRPVAVVAGATFLLGAVACGGSVAGRSPGAEPGAGDAASSDAGAPVDAPAEGALPMDATADAIADAAGEGAADSGAPGDASLPATTEAILSAQGPQCLPCAQTNGCLDPSQGAALCQGLSAPAPAACGSVVGAPAPTEAQVCLHALQKTFVSGCAVSLQATPCVCGATPVVACTDGTTPATGVFMPDFRCDLGTSDVPTIFQKIGDLSHGVNVANSILLCVGGFDCPCFGQ